ncbi:MAG: hypothetical protein ACKVOQ_17280 [Cyclobacteriaceae bacterium]
MNFRVVKLEDYSGSKATIYSIILEEDEQNQTTLFEHFVTENLTEHREEVKNIASRLRTIGQKSGARDHFFKDREGKPGDGVCALYDDPDKNLRLYCIRFGTGVLVVGGGGHKPKTMRALQESEKLTLENHYMKIVSQEIAHRIREREITWADDEIELLGDFNFYKND